MDEQPPRAGALPGGDSVLSGDGALMPVPAARLQAGPAPDSGPACTPVTPVTPAASGLDEHFARLAGELAAGRVQAPSERDIDGPAISISLGDACDVDPGLLPSGRSHATSPTA